MQLKLTKLVLPKWHSVSGIPRILEWEGLRCRRHWGDETWARGIPLPTWERVWGEACVPSPEFCSYLWLKIPYYEAFWHIYFLNYTPMEGVLTPLTLSSVCHCIVYIGLQLHQGSGWLLKTMAQQNIHVITDVSQQNTEQTQQQSTKTWLIKQKLIH